MNWPDFVFRRLNKIEPERFEVEAKRSLIEYIRSDRPIGPSLRGLIAGTLESYFFPVPKAIRERDRKRIYAQALKEMIDYRTEDLKAAGERKPRTRAEEEVARNFGLSVDALRKRIGRHRRS